jgi:hypothetical protein
MSIRPLFHLQLYVTNAPLFGVFGIGRVGLSR